jgi:hypothetical protein
VGTYKNRISPGIMVQGSSPGGDPSKTIKKRIANKYSKHRKS